MSLKAKAISGVKWTALSAVIVNVIQFVQVVVLARFLEPSAFGLMAVVTVVVGFSQAFADMGISNAIIHKQDIDNEQLSTLYWVNIISGAALFIFISIFAPLVAAFYKEPDLTLLIVIVGSTFLLQSFGQQFMVLQKKEMRFDMISKVDIASMLASLAVSASTAFMGFGVYALVWGIMAKKIVETGIFIIIGMKMNRPSFVFKLNKIHGFISFGMYQMGEKTVNYFNYQIDTLLIGKLVGIEALGIYTIAKQLVMKPAQIFNPIIGKVTFPAMAKIQNDTLKLKNTYLKIINYLSSANFPIYVFIFIFADELIKILFGPEWVKAAPVMQILSIWGALRSTGNPVGSLLLAKGKARLAFLWNLGLLFYVPVVLFISSKWGLIGVSWGLAALAVSLMIPNWYFLVRPLCGAKFMEYHKQIAIPAFVSVLTGLCVFAAVSHIEPASVRLLFGTVIGGVLLLLLNYFINKGFLNELKSFFK